MLLLLDALLYSSTVLPDCLQQQQQHSESESANSDVPPHSRRRVLYVDMGLELPTEGEALPTHMQCSEVLGPLSSLAIVSLGACHLEVSRAMWAAQ